MKTTRQIQNYMTPMPHSISKDISAEEALSVMKDQQVRHLTVLEKGDFQGVITERNIQFAKMLDSGWNWKCGDVMSPHPSIVTPETPLDEVLKEMASHKLEYTLIQHPNGNIIGIFTEIDAFLILAELIAPHSEKRSAVTHVR